VVRTLATIPANPPHTIRLVISAEDIVALSLLLVLGFVAVLVIVIFGLDESNGCTTWLSIFLGKLVETASCTSISYQYTTLIVVLTKRAKQCIHSACRRSEVN
jgi:hypothetical protein